MVHLYVNDIENDSHRPLHSQRFQLLSGTKTRNSQNSHTLIYETEHLSEELKHLGEAFQAKGYSSAEIKKYYIHEES